MSWKSPMSGSWPPSEIPPGLTGATSWGPTPPTKRPVYSGQKNFIAGAWGMMTDAEDWRETRPLSARRSTTPMTPGISPSPTSISEMGFDPAMGFVPRKGIHKLIGRNELQVLSLFPALAADDESPDSALRRLGPATGTGRVTGSSRPPSIGAWRAETGSRST